jgi:hypothetical protein
MKRISGITWFMLEIWELIWAKWGMEGGKCLLCARGGGSLVLLKCRKMEMRLEELLNNKWPNMKDATASKELLTG